MNFRAYPCCFSHRYYNDESDPYERNNEGGEICLIKRNEILCQIKCLYLANPLLGKQKKWVEVVLLELTRESRE